MLMRMVTEKLFRPVSDKKLKAIVHFTFGFAFLTSLALGGVLGVADNGFIREAFLAITGVLVCVSLCKTLYHEALPLGYIRYGSYIMAVAYSLVVANEVILKLQSMGPVTV